MRILIPTCDSYAHTVPIHVHYLRKLWPQCPYDVTVLTTEAPINVDAEVVRLGKDLGYANNLLAYIARFLRDDLIMLCLDDLVPVEIHPRRIARAIEVLRTDQSVRMVRLSKRFTTEGIPYKHDSLFVEMANDSNYLFSQKCTIWRTDIFRRLLRKDATPWGAEWIGARRARRMRGRFLGAAKPILTQRNWYIHRKRDRKTTEWVQENW